MIHLCICRPNCLLNIQVHEVVLALNSNDYTYFAVFLQKIYMETKAQFLSINLDVGFLC